MAKMTYRERHDWMHRSGRVHMVLSTRATSGGFDCDACGAPSASIGHTGDGTPVVVRCADCFRASIATMRATRPSLSEMIARVDRDIMAAHA